MNQLTLMDALGLVDSQSPLNGQDSKQSPFVKSQNTQIEFSPIIGQASQTTETCESAPMFTPNFSPAVSHAHRFPLQDDGSVREMIATSGRQCSTLLDESSPIGAFSKTLLTSKTWFSQDALMSWRKEAISTRHSIFRLALLDYQAWNGTSGLLPRVTASDWKGVRKRSFRGSENKERFSASGGRFCQQLRTTKECGIYLSVDCCELVKGFPITWSELPASETQFRRPSRSKSLKPSES